MEECRRCNGTADCTRCEGKGVVEGINRVGKKDDVYTRPTCPKCQGTRICRYCVGGLVLTSK